jgi:hypothetical protein
VKPLVYSYIAGLGGRDVTLDTLSRILRETMNTDMPPVESVWVDCG